MKDKLDKILSEDGTEELKRRVMSRALPIVREYAEKSPGFFAWLYNPVLWGGSLAAVAAAVFLLLQMQAPDSAIVAQAQMHAYDPQMLADSEMLLDLKVFERWEELQKKSVGPWRKKKG